MNKFSFTTILMLLFVMLIFTQRAYSDLSRKKTRKGIKSYEQAQWDESSQYFQDALLDDPENPTGHFNLGGSQYKRKNYEESLKSYEKALATQDINLKQKSYYNLGNTYYQMNKYQESIQSYIKALDLNPDDADAKYNLELVRAKLKEMAQKQPMQNQPQQQQGDQQNQGENENKKENQEQQEDQQQGEQQQENQQSQQEQQQAQAQEAENEKELSKEEAERILQALKSEEKENQKLRRAKQSSQKVRVEKDW